MKDTVGYFQYFKVIGLFIMAEQIVNRAHTSYTLRGSHVLPACEQSDLLTLHDLADWYNKCGWVSLYIFIIL